jgi:hypothetical protein
MSVDSSNPLNLTTGLDYKDTWHVSAGAQRRLSEAWRLNFGVGYDLHAIRAILRASGGAQEHDGSPLSAAHRCQRQARSSTRRVFAVSRPPSFQKPTTW